MTEKCRKLLALCLCPSAQAGEYRNAAVAFIMEARKSRETPATLFQGERHEIGFKFKFGSHKDEALEDIDTGYLEWAHINLKKLAPSFRAAIFAELRRREQ